MIYIPVWFKLYLHIRIKDIYLSLKKNNNFIDDQTQSQSLSNLTINWW